MTLADNLAKLNDAKRVSKARRKQTLDTILSIAQERQAAARQSTPSGTEGGTGARSTALERLMGSSTGGKSGPHHAGDGHNHGGGGQTVGEANELWRRLQTMLKDSPHKITPGARTRDYATQVRLYNAYKAGKGPQAARPGTSKHGNGRANDLQYSNDAARAWALANAKRYGLHFPIYNPKLPRSRDESWHIELLK